MTAVWSCFTHLVRVKAVRFPQYWGRRGPLRTFFTRSQWEKEDAEMTPEEIAEENRTWEEFKANINAERDRAGARRVF